MPAKKVNGVDGVAVQKLLNRVFTIDDKAASIMGSAMAEVKSLREDVKDIIVEAENRHHVDPVAMRKLIKFARIRRKLETEMKDVPDSISEHIDTLVASLGWDDTPLGAFATDARNTKADDDAGGEEAEAKGDGSTSGADGEEAVADALAGKPKAAKGKKAGLSVVH